METPGRETSLKMVLGLLSLLVVFFFFRLLQYIRRTADIAITATAHLVPVLEHR